MEELFAFAVFLLVSHDTVFTGDTKKNMAPKKSKVKKPKVKRSIAQPAKSINKRTICAHPMLKRVQKEVRELKKKSVKKYKK